MASNDNQSRQKFLEMMIQELSRQQNEDATSFFAPPPPAEDALFRKMCFDFPEMSDDSLNQLATATNKCIENLVDANASKKGAKCALDQVFCLHDTFVENVVTMCNAVAAPESTKANESLPQGKHKLACVLFLRVPKLLLQSNTDTLLPLLNAAPNSVTWKDIILKFQSFVSLSTVSIFAAGSSNAAGSVQQLLADSACLADTCAVVAELGAFIVQAEQLLGQLDASTAPTNTKADSSTGGVEGTESGETAKEKASHALAASLQLLDSLGKIGTKGNTIPSLSTLLQALLDSARSAPSAAHNEHTQRLSAAVTVLKSSWLHLTFLVRDLLLLFPALIPSKAVLLLKSLHTKGEKEAFSMRKPDLFPTSAECLYVLSLSSLAAHVCSDSRSNDASTTGTATSNVLVCAQAKEALRVYLDTSDNLSTFVTLCGRMNKYHSAPSATTTSSTTALCIDAESSGFLIDVGMLYLSDPVRVRTSATVSGNANNSTTTPGLISSQLLSTLLFTMVGVLQQVIADRQSASFPSNPTLLAFTARLSRFFALLPVGVSHNLTQNVILRYLLDFPDLLLLLLQASNAEEVAAGAVPGLMTPVQCLGIVVPLLLSAQSTYLQPSAGVIPATVVSTLIGGAGSATSGTLSGLQYAITTYRVAADVYAKEKANSQSQSAKQEDTTNEPEPVSADVETVTETAAALNLQQKVASDKAQDSSDSDTEEKQTLPFQPPTQPPLTLNAEAAAVSAHKKYLHQQVNTLLALLNSLNEVLVVIVGEGAGGNVVRLVSSVKAVEQPVNKRSPNTMVHNTLLYFATEALRVVQGLVVLVNRNDSASEGTGAGAGVTNGDSQGSRSSGSPLLSKAEAAKKQLKALQELLQGKIMGVNQSVADDGAAQLKENAEYLIRMKTLEVDLDARLKKVEEEAKINREIRLMKLGVNIEEGNQLVRELTGIKTMDRQIALFVVWFGCTYIGCKHLYKAYNITHFIKTSDPVMKAVYGERAGYVDMTKLDDTFSKNMRKYRNRGYALIVSVPLLIMIMKHRSVKSNTVRPS